MQSNVYDLIVVGGGASGMMAAGRAAARGKKVLLIEKNKVLGAKLSITGGGRCNITNAQHDVHELLAHYGEGADFLFSPFSQFGVKDTFSFFESHGLPIVVQAGGRAFPTTEKAPDVVRALVDYMKKGGVMVKTGTAVTKVQHEKGSIAGVHVGDTLYTAKNFIFATGGMSHPETGSTGDGFEWLRALGHSVKAPTPTIVPLATTEKWGHTLSGTALDGMKITFFADGQKAFSKTGKILFTHFGISGPLVLNSAAQVADLMHQGIVTAKIDVFPQENIGSLDTRITTVFDTNKNKLLKNVLKDIVPAGMSPGIVHLLSEKMLDTKVHSITKEERRTLVDILKALPLTITHLMDYDRAVIADGGISLNEIDTKTMRSTLFTNLYVTGDLLHVRRPSGGYSLQLCWTTGWVAGSSV